MLELNQAYGNNMRGLSHILFLYVALDLKQKALVVLK